MMRGTQLRTEINLVFRPHPLVRNQHLQTVLSSMREPKAPGLKRNSQMVILEGEDGIRLQGFYSQQRQGRAKGLVLLLHGWLGCSEAPYVSVLGEYLYTHGYNIFRLNLRDHGDTHHLNSGIFRSDLIDEVFSATRQITRLAKDQPFYIVGFSLGGNFALRLAWLHSQVPLANLQHTVAICPAVNPCHTTQSLDKQRLYLSYFRRRWRRVFKTKQRLFPMLYDFSKELAAPTCMAMTEAFIKQYSPHETAQAYFDAYEVTPQMMSSLTSPVTMLAAVDDPVVPAEDFAPFYTLSPQLQVSMQPYGGHVGFIDIFPFRYWASEFVHTLLEPLHPEQCPELVEG